MHCDDVAMLDPQVVANDTVDTCAAVIEVVVRQHN